MNTIEFKVLGLIRTPYKQPEDIPIQGKFRPNVIGHIHVFSEFRDCIKDLNQFSHLMLFYQFNRVNDEKHLHKPFLEDVEHGCFATRNNKRVNKLGFSIVKFETIQDNKIYFSEVDILDETPLIDIKPYVTHFDNRDNVKSGWYDKHFKNGSIPKNTILKKDNL